MEQGIKVIFERRGMGNALVPVGVGGWVDGRGRQSDVGVLCLDGGDDGLWAGAVYHLESNLWWKVMLSRTVALKMKAV